MIDQRLKGLTYLVMGLDAKLDRILGCWRKTVAEKKKRKKTAYEIAMETDPEFRAAMEGVQERMIERIKKDFREERERERLRAEREAEEERRRERLRRLTFGLLPR